MQRLDGRPAARRLEVATGTDGAAGSVRREGGPTQAGDSGGSVLRAVMASRRAQPERLRLRPSDPHRSLQQEPKDVTGLCVVFLISVFDSLIFGIKYF